MATIAEKSRTKEIIDRLQTILDTAPSVPLAAGKISIYKDEVQTLLMELASQIDIELKTYHEVNDRKGKIISEAKKEAERIIYEAERTASRMRVKKHTTGVAPLDYSTLNEEERSALGNANEIYAASLIYTDEMLTEVTDMISNAYHNIRSDYEIILQAFEDKMNIINNNRMELMEGLQEMDLDDRSQQILEIGQLLSNELYTSRMKARMNSDEYEDGSVQLSLNLQEEQEAKTRQAEEKAQQAEAALAQIIAERDALAQKVERLKTEEMQAAIEHAKQLAIEETRKAVLEEVQQTSLQAEPEEDEEEYEIVYVTEDELEEGEEYEIEYVDEEIEEYEVAQNEMTDVEETEPQNGKIENEAQSVQIEKVIKEENTVKKKTKENHKNTSKEETKAESTVTTSNKKATKSHKTKNEKTDDKKEAKEADKELENLDISSEKLVVVPHFKKSESVASVPGEKVAKMATAITTDKKYSGLIERAVKQREQANIDAAVKVVDDKSAEEIATTKEVADEKPKTSVKDKDIRKDANGKEYLQATMVFDENFEITEF